MILNHSQRRDDAFQRVAGLPMVYGAVIGCSPGGMTPATASAAASQSPARLARGAVSEPTLALCRSAGGFGHGARRSPRRSPRWRQRQLSAGRRRAGGSAGIILCVCIRDPCPNFRQLPPSKALTAAETLVVCRFGVLDCL